jgi:hypothetical protein
MRTHTKLTRRTCLAWAALITTLAACAVALAAWPSAGQAQGSGFSLRFYGHGTGNIDRVRIALGNPSLARPVNVGNGDFTIEFWMKAAEGSNANGHQCTAQSESWTNSHLVIDRDVLFAGDYGDYGIGLASGRLAFGVHNGQTGITLCGTANVVDGSWHHIAVQRRLSDGLMTLYVDGVIDAQTVGPMGRIDYNPSHPNPAANDPYLVLGAEKHDVGSAYSGLLDEVRLSNVLRYSGSFTPSLPYSASANTVGLYHFDEGPAGACTTGFVITDSSGGSSNGECRYGSLPAPQGPEFTTDIPPFNNPTPTNTATSTATSTATNTPTPTNTAAPGDTPTPTNTPTSTPTAALTPTATRTPTPGPSPTPTKTFTPGPSPTPTNTPTPTPTPTPLPPVAFDGTPQAIPLANEAIVRWDTNIPANSQVRYGETCASLSNVLTSTIQTAQHSVVLNSLTPLTQYCYQVKSDNGLSATAWSADQTFTTLESEWRVFAPVALRTDNP